ncbi:MAG TPA: KilA-N domain-containing protein [Nitrosarchaeum sp.]|nr:KilA-N domain-containing protein [Nitrosarchaeum sp.]
MFSFISTLIKKIVGCVKTDVPNVKYTSEKWCDMCIIVMNDTRFNATNLCWLYGKSFSGWYNNKKIKKLRKCDTVLTEVYIREGMYKGIYVDKQFLDSLKEWIDAPCGKGSGEKIIQEKLALELDGVMEVEIKFGRIDILTSKEIIEVKNYDSWKHALGQIMIYGLSYPKHNKRIHLFDVPFSTKKEYSIEDVRNALKSYGVTLSIETIVM